MYYSLQYIYKLFILYNNSSESTLLGEENNKIRKTSFSSPVRGKNEVFRIIDMYYKKSATVSAFQYI